MSGNPPGASDRTTGRTSPSLRRQDARLWADATKTTEMELRVRYAETDQMGVAHHASYLVWFEAARTEFIRARGRSYDDVEKAGWLLMVIEAQCRYRRPARYDEVLVIRTQLRSLGPVTLSFGYQVARRADGEVLADGYTVHAVVDRGGRARRIPEEIAAPLRAVVSEEQQGS